MTLTKQLAEVLFSVLGEPTESNGLRQAIAGLQYSDWQRLHKVVASLGLFPSFYGKLSNLKPAGLASDFLCRFKQGYLLNLQRNLFSEQELLKIIFYLSDNDIAVVPLKGPIFTRLYYQDMAFRQAPVDLDLLVKDVDLAKTRRILEDAGYSSLHPEHKKDFLQPVGLDRKITQICLVKKTEVLWNPSLDMHTCIRGFYRQEQIDALWQQTRHIRIGEAEILALSNEDLLLYLSVISISLLESLQLRYLYDIHRLIMTCQKVLDWDNLLYKAKKYNLSHCLYFPLELSRSLFGTEIPIDLLKDIAPGRAIRKLIGSYIDKEQFVLQPQGIKFDLITRLMLCRYLYSRSWGDFFNKLFIRSCRGGKNERHSRIKKEPRYGQQNNRGRNHSYAALQDIR